MQTIAQQTMSLDQVEEQIRKAARSGNVGQLTRSINQLRAARWAGQTDEQRAKVLMRNAKRARNQLHQGQEDESDGSSDG